MVHELAVGLQAAGHEVLLCAPRDSECPVPKHSLLDEAEGARIGQVEVELRHVIDAYDEVTEFDIVHDHTVSPSPVAIRPRYQRSSFMLARPTSLSLMTSLIS